MGILHTAGIVNDAGGIGRGFSVRERVPGEVSNGWTVEVEFDRAVKAGEVAAGDSYVVSAGRDLGDGETGTRWSGDGKVVHVDAGDGFTEGATPMILSTIWKK